MHTKPPLSTVRGLAPLARQHPRAKGLKGWWLFGESAGATVYDLGGYNLHGALTNATVGTAWHIGPWGPVLSFDGTDDYVNLPAHVLFSLDPAKSYSWTFWIRPADFTEWRSLWIQQESTSPSAEFIVYVHTTADTTFGPVTAGVSANWNDATVATNLTVHTNDSVLAANTWAHVAICYDASVSQASRMAIFVNGVDVTATGDVNSNGTLATVINPAAGKINIGRDGDWGDPEFNGRIGEVRYYHRLLSRGDIASLIHQPLLEYDWAIAPMQPRRAHIPASGGGILRQMLMHDHFSGGMAA